MKWLVGIILVLGIAFVGWWFTYGQYADTPLEESTPVPFTEDEEEIEAPEARYPIDDVETTTEVSESDEDLPPVPESDPTVAAWLNTALGQEMWTQLLRNENLVRRAVATVDNLDADQLPERANVFQTPDTGLVTEELADDSETGSGSDDAAADADGESAGPAVQLTERNAVRYQPWVDAMQQIQDEAALQAYVRYYPLFQKAYNDLGKDGAYFNDRLVAIIDHLLATPEVEFPIDLQPAENNRYIFADEELEALSVGQKALVRMGPAHAGVVKDRLSVLRDHLSGSAGTPAVTPTTTTGQDLAPDEDLDSLEVDLTEPLDRMPMDQVEERFNTVDETTEEAENATDNAEEESADGDTSESDPEDPGNPDQRR